MISITYDREKYSVKIRGHAESAEKGHDLICAAVSAVTYTLAQNVAELSKDRKKVRRPKIKLSSGDAEISCAPVHGLQSVVKVIFDAVCIGYAVIADEYPQHVKYTIRDRKSEE